MSEKETEDMVVKKNTLFEQEAVNRILQEFGTKGELITRTRIWEDGANFGYDKGYHDANEWHYVKDGDLPKGDGLFVIYWKLGDIDNYMIFKGTIGNLHKDAIAWKEITPLKEHTK